MVENQIRRLFHGHIEMPQREPNAKNRWKVNWGVTALTALLAHFFVEITPKRAGRFVAPIYASTYAVRRPASAHPEMPAMLGFM